MPRDLGTDRPLALPADPRPVRSGLSYARLVQPVVRNLDAEIETRSEALARDMKLRNLAHRAGDRESVEAFEFRMRETYGELLPRLVVRGLVNLVPHLGVLLALYYLLPVLTLPGGVAVSTVSAYIAVGVAVLLVRALTKMRSRRRGDEEPHQQS